MIAARTVQTITALRQCFTKNRDFSQPSRARKKESSGDSKASPRAMSIPPQKAMNFRTER